MMPKAGGQYVYLREAYSPLWGFLYGWTLFLVIQTGTIAAVAVGFARFLGVLVPSISPTTWIVPPIDLSEQVRDQPLGAATGRHPADRLPHLAQHPRHQARQADPEHLHLGQDAVAHRPDRARHPRRAATPRRSPPTSPTSGRRTTSRRSGPDLPSRRRPRRRPAPSACSSPSASPRWARCSRPTPGTTSPSPPAR